MAIERSAYSFPWTRGNFIDSLAAGYLAEVLVRRQRRAARLLRRDDGRRRDAPAEPDGRAGTAAARACAHAARCAGAALPRRSASPSCGSRCAPATSARAQLYARRGFAEVGLRRGYYPAGAAQREDAVVMSLRAAGGAGDGAGLSASARCCRRWASACGRRWRSRRCSVPPRAQRARGRRRPATPRRGRVAARGCADAGARSRCRGPRPTSARRSIATLPWPALREAVAACTACGLCQGRRQTVFGVGHAQRALDDRRRSAGRAGGPEGRTLRRRGRAAARQHAARAAA